MRATVALLLSLIPFNLFAAGRPIAPRPIVPAPYTIRMASTAFAAGRFLSVWIYDTHDAGAHIVGVFSDGEGRRISPEWFPILTSVQPQWLQLVGTGDSYVLFWRGQANLTHMAEIDAQGRVTRHIETEAETDYGSAIAWNGTYFITVNPDVQQSEAAIFDRDGRIVRRELLESAYHVSIVPLADGFLTFGATWGGLFAQHVSAAGDRAARWKLDDGSGTTSGSIPKNIRAIATPGGDVLAVWIRGRFDSAQDLKSVVFRDGAPLPSRVILHSTDVVPLHLTAVDGGYRLIGASSAALARLSLDRDGAPRGGFTPVAGASSGGAFAEGDGTTLVLSAASRVTTTAIPRDGDARAEVVSLAPARQTDPVVSAAGGNFVAAWTESSADATFIRTAFLAPWGETLSSATVLENAALDARRLTWNGSELLLIARRGDSLLGLRLSRTGLPVDDTPFAIGQTDPPSSSASSVVWAGDRWIVAWSRNQRLFTAEVPASGAAGPARELTADSHPPAGWSQWRRSPSLAASGSDVVIVWNEQQEEIVETPFPVIGNRDVRAYVFAARLGDAEATVIARDAYHTAAASSGSELLVVAGGRTFVVRGKDVLSRALFHDPYGILSDVVWDGGEFVVASRYGGFQPYLAVHRLDRNGVPVSARFTPVLFPDFSRDVPPSIAAERWASAIVALHEVSAPGDTQQVVSFLERELQPLVEPPPVPRRRSTRH